MTSRLRQPRHGCAISLAALVLTGLTPAIGDAAAYRDLNHNGRLDPYENARLSAQVRAEDLLSRMTVAEKVGAMLHGTLPTTGDPLGHGSTSYDLIKAGALINTNAVNSFITRLSLPPEELARQNNAVQKLAERSRLGIPVTISTDPRNHFQVVLGASTMGGGFSLWPETLGFAAVGDPALVARFGDIARQEYRAVGIHVALSPQADLATEPRWPRTTATFGSRSNLVSKLVGAYVAGFQHGADGLKPDGVAVVVKHWVGYGAEPHGFDAHNQYGRIVHLDDEAFRNHVSAFSGAFAAKAEGVMPTYAIVSGPNLDGRPLETVGSGFSKQLLTKLLREEKGFKGLIVSDWAITNDCPTACSAPTADHPQSHDAIGMPWGLEDATKTERFARGVEAGIDQFGGVDDPAPLLAAVHDGRITAARLDVSVRKILLQKFRLGLFDNPFVDPEQAKALVGGPAFQAAADAAQRRAQVVLENKGGLLPVAENRKVWLFHVDPDSARAAGLTVVSSPREADFAIVRASTPAETLHPYAFFGSRQNEGRLNFRDGDADYEALKQAASAVPTVFVINMDRPAILTNVRDKARAIVVTFGASDAAVLAVLTGKAQAEGRLPFELPSSMAEVEQQNPAIADDTAHPLYPRGAGLTIDAP